jgi:hypothetical protein
MAYAELCISENSPEIQIGLAIKDFLLNGNGSENSMKFISSLKCERTDDQNADVVVQSYDDKHMFMNVDFSEGVYTTQVWALMEFHWQNGDNAEIAHLAFVATMIKVASCNRYIPYDKITYMKDSNNDIECNIVNAAAFSSGTVVFPLKNTVQSESSEFIYLPQNRMFPDVTKRYTDILKRVETTVGSDKRFTYFLSSTDVSKLVSIVNRRSGAVDDDDDDDDDDDVDDYEV